MGRARLASGIIGVVGAAIVASGISLPAQTPTPLPTFEAATIKPSDPASQGQYIRRQPGGRFSTSNMPVRDLIRFAYGVQDFQLDGLPAWAASERFDITAKAEGDPPPMPPGSDSDPLILMVRSLLMERLQLKVHRETKEMPIYALTRLRPDRLGPRLEPSALDCQAIVAAAQAGARAGGPPPQPPPPDASGRPTCGIRGGFGTLAGNGFPIAQLANTLAQLVRRTVVDRTGLTGPWAFDLKFAMDANQMPFAAPPGVQAPPIDPDAPSVYTAVEEQLGLKLESTRGPVEMVIVDRLERPIPD